MTQSVCLLCGAFKSGAWIACPECRHVPIDVRDKAKHLLASEHHLSSPVLQSTAASIRAGHSPDFPEDRVQTEIREIESLERDGESGFALSLVSLALVLFLLGAGALWVWLV